jgi:hypothetical protein
MIEIPNALVQPTTNSNAVKVSKYPAKTAITLAAFCVQFYAVATVPASAEDTKTDVFGIYAGMPRADVNKLIETNKWSCSPGYLRFADFYCTIRSGQTTSSMNIYTALEIPGHPIKGIRLFVTSAEPLEAVMESISKQYGKQPSVLHQQKGSNMYRWGLGNGSILDVSVPYGMDKYMMDLYSPSIMEQNQKNEREKELIQNPTPKF